MQPLRGLLVLFAAARAELRVPLVAKDVVGAALASPYRELPFESVFVADASRHGAHDINEALRAGLDVVLAPGIFQLEDSIRMARPGAVVICVEINQCAGCTRQFFTNSFLGEDVAALAPSSGEEPTPPRYRAGVASMAWRSTRRFRTNAP